jgi:hypothetical protein
MTFIITLSVTLVIKTTAQQFLWLQFFTIISLIKRISDRDYVLISETNLTYAV